MRNCTFVGDFGPSAALVSAAAARLPPPPEKTSRFVIIGAV